jgi:hypothetical protein
MAQSSHGTQLAACIVDCLECYSVCRQHATSKVMDDCAEICRSAADFMLRGSTQYREVCALCASICEACAKHCEDAGAPEECVRSCRGCAESCRSLAGAG